MIIPGDHVFGAQDEILQISPFKHSATCFLRNTMCMGDGRKQDQ
jgi:hypothetical protein